MLNKPKTTTKKKIGKYQIVNWFPDWKGFWFGNWTGGLGKFIYDWSLGLGFIEIRKWKKL